MAMGEILRRLTSKGFSHAVAGGCEAMAHTLRQVVDDPDLLILQVDLFNAYNMADREARFKDIERLFPKCLSWVLRGGGRAGL